LGISDSRFFKRLRGIGFARGFTFSEVIRVRSASENVTPAAVASLINTPTTLCGMRRGTLISGSSDEGRAMAIGCWVFDIQVFTGSRTESLPAPWNRKAQAFVVPGMLASFKGIDPRRHV